MASWHPALWLLIMGPCCLVVRTRCPELGWWFSAAANGKERRVGNSDYSSWCLFFLNIQVLRWELQGPVVEALPLVLFLCPWSSGQCWQRPLGHASPFPPRIPPEVLPAALPSSGAPRGVIGLGCHGSWVVLWIPSSPGSQSSHYYAPIYLFIFLGGSLMNDFVRQAV